MADQQPLPPTVQGLTEAEYQAWRHHPVSKLLLSYLKDKRAAVGDAVSQAWISTGEPPDKTLRGQIIEMEEIENLPFAAFIAMYGDDAANKKEDEAPAEAEKPAEPTSETGY